MKTLYQSLLLAISALALAGTAYAQVPSSNDTSDGDNNTGMGTGALAGVATMDNGAAQNTAAGFGALFSNTSGCCNAAFGVDALQRNNGSDNTGLGYGALENNTTADSNTATGAFALYTNTTGSSNTATGYQALAGPPGPSGSTGSNNTAVGGFALQGNTSGNNNTASGFQALIKNSTASNNTASGANALYANTTGNDNTAAGVGALVKNVTGNYNVAEGAHAGGALTTGSSNITVGYEAGLKLTTGSYNIDIGNPGVAADSGVIRIGTSLPATLQTKTFVAGIYNVPLTGNAVVVTSTGQLGVQAVSSERFKTAIAPMGSNTAKLEQLRPVTFHLKTDPHGALQYGLIAEDVAKVYPELVIRNESGRIDGVRYDELAPMLLNEMQKRKAAQDQHIAAQDAKISQLMGQLAEMHAALAKLPSKDGLVAQR